MDYKRRIIELPQNRVWRSYQGGRILDEIVGKREPHDSHFPEDWIGSVTPARNPGTQDANAGLSEIELDGRRMLFADLIALDPNYFLGAEHVERYGAQPMVLVKLLDSAVRLQLQVHPTAEFARTHLNSDSGKAEAYYILGIREAVEEAFVYLGFQRPPSREELRRCIAAQDMEAMQSFFDKIMVKPGDVLFVPGGIPHAIGAGLFLVEIMEPSDLVVRFEFESAGYTLPESARFMGRDLDFCLDVFNFETKPEALVRRDYMFRPAVETEYGKSGRRYQLIGANTTPRFQVKKSEIQGVLLREEDTFYTGVVTSGRCVLQTDAAAVSLNTFDKFFIPAGLGPYSIEAESEVHILECFPPAIPRPK